jgi:hypothetical protein
MSAVFVKQDGEWKVTDQQISIGVPNEKLVGQETTTDGGRSLDRRSAERERGFLLCMRPRRVRDS